MTEFKMVPLGEIRPDPNQPRKFFDEQAMTELTNSVNQKGVIQPILIRPNGKGYLLVCGERRYRAAKAVHELDPSRRVIPAVIRELSDSEALDLQIIENLQRKDVHPMEEAVAFLSLSEVGKDIDEIAKRVGKSVYYVRQRIRLNALNENWQKAFFVGVISITDALKISMLSTDDQDTLYEDEVQHGKVGAQGYSVEISDWDINKFSGMLDNAPFDITDEGLIKNVGACTNCKFNSAVASLFPDEVGAKCSNSNCFKQKAEASFKIRIEAEVENPDIVFISTEYGSRKPELDKLAKEYGIAVYDRNSYRLISQEDAPDRKEFMEYEADDYETTEELEKAWEEKLEEYAKECEEIKQHIASGKYKRALVVIGDDKGTYQYVQLDNGAKAKAATAKMVKEKESEGSITISDIDAEIARIKERDKRSLKTDEHKIWAAIHPHFNPSSNTSMIKGGFSPLEVEAAATAIYDKIDYMGKDDFRKHFKVKSGKNMFSGTTVETLMQMIRFFYLSEIPPAPTSLQNGFNDMATLSLRIADEFFPSVIDDIRKKQAEVAEKRFKKSATRIQELQLKKKEIKSSNKK